MTLLAPFLAVARAAPGRVAIVEPGGARITFGDLAARSAARARAFAARGIGKGDRVLVATGLGIELYACLAGLWRLGAVPVFPEPTMGLRGLCHAARIAAPRALLAGWTVRLLALLRPELRAIPLRLPTGGAAAGDEPLAPCGADDPALISFTSGSTGAPKGMVRTHGVLMAQHEALAPFLAPAGGDEVALVGFPVFVLAHLGLGVTAVLAPRRDDRDPAAPLHALMAREAVTRALLPPGTCQALAARPAPTALRCVVTGGGPVFPDLLRRLRAWLPDGRIRVLYGSTEAEPIAVLDLADATPGDWAAMSAGAGLLVGAPVPAATLRIEADEVLVAGPHVVPGYLDPTLDAANKVRLDGRLWHRTGDAGRLDGQGRLWLLGRRAARAGDVLPFAVEAAARAWPGVTACALVPSGRGPVLLAEGDPALLPDWRAAAAALGPLEVIHVPRIPLDARHHSKVDYAALRRLYGHLGQPRAAGR